MISKKAFVNVIEKLKTSEDRIKRNHIKGPDYNVIVIKLLGREFLNIEVLNWWIYNKNFGRTFKIGDLTENDKEIDVSTSEKLYDYLISLKKLKEEA